MNKQELISNVARRMDVTKVMATEFVDSFIVAISQSIERKEEVKISWFGTFKVVERKARNGINPKTLKPMKIPAMNSVSFKVSKLIKEVVR